MGGVPSRVPSAAWAVGAVLLSIVSAQWGAVLAKSVMPIVAPQGMTALRTAFATMVLAAIWRPWRGPRPTARQLRVIVAYGASLGFMNLLFYAALQRLPLGVAVAIEFIGPFALALLSSRKPIDLLWIGLAIAGLAGLLPLAEVSDAVDPLGVAYALGAGTCWALYIVFSQKAGTELPGARAAALGMAVAAGLTAPFGVVLAGSALLSPTLLGTGLVVAILSSAVPYPLEMIALRRLSARSFGILMSLEPAVAAISGLVALGENLGLRQWVAILAVVAASIGTTATTPRNTGTEATPAA